MNELALLRRYGPHAVSVERNDVEYVCTLNYVGQRDGQHVWKIVWPPIYPGDKVTVLVLPPHNQVIWTEESRP